MVGHFQHRHKLKFTYKKQNNVNFSLCVAVVTIQTSAMTCIYSTYTHIQQYVYEHRCANHLCKREIKLHLVMFVA